MKKWLYVQKGSKQKKIIFIACENDKPIRSFTDMNLAYHFEAVNEFSNSISDFNKLSAARIEAQLNGIDIEDTRPIISVKDFTKIQKEHKTELKI